MESEAFEALMLEKLAGIRHPEERLFFKNIIEAGFLSIARHDEALFRELTQRVFSEVETDSAQYGISSTLVRRRDIDTTHAYLRPILPEDAQEPRIDLDALQTGLQSKAPVYLRRVFFRCDYREMQRLLATGRSFPVTIRTSRGAVPSRATLRHCSAYRQRFEALYRVFVRNRIPWFALNCPHAFKLLDVWILPPGSALPGEIESVTVDFQEYKPRAFEDCVPMWNLERVEVRSAGFAEPCLDHVLFKHHIALRELGAQNGFLVEFDAGEVDSVRRMRDSLELLSREENVRKWSLLRILQPKQRETEVQREPIFSNARNSSFAGALSESRRALRTKAELFQRIGSFVDSEALPLRAIDVLEDGAFPGETYDIHPYLSDEIRMGKYARSLRLTFENRLPEEQTYLARDVMSFLTAQAALLYPEYNCRGVLA